MHLIACNFFTAIGEHDSASSLNFQTNLKCYGGLGFWTYIGFIFYLQFQLKGVASTQENL